MPGSFRKKTTATQNIVLVVAPVLSLFIIFFVDLDPENKKVTYTFAIALLMAIWWITEAIPLAATALLSVALFPLFGIVDGKTISAMYFNHLIFLFIGGIATLVGTPPNLSFARIIGIIFPNVPEITFADWLLFALPVSVVMFLAAWVLLYIMYKPRGKWEKLSREDFRSEYNNLGKAKPEEKIVFILFLIPSKTEKGRRIMDWHTAGRIPWHIVLLFGGGFALAKGFVDSGLSLWFGESLSGLSSVSPILLTLVFDIDVLQFPEWAVSR